MRENGIGLFVVFIAIAWTLGAILITRAIVRHNVTREVEERCSLEYAQMFEEYKQEQMEAEAKEYWLSGEASFENSLNRDATLICKGNGIWTTDEARYGYWCNVMVRVMSPDYPNNVEDVLKQSGQYTFWDENAMVDEASHKKCVELLRQFYSGVLPAHLTLKHQFLEMRDNGATCILHTTYDHRGSDDPWRWKD